MSFLYFNIEEKPLEFELIFYAELYQITRMLAWKVIIVVILTENLELGVIQPTQIQGLNCATFPPVPVSMNSYAACELTMQQLLDLTYHKSLNIWLQ